MTGTEPVWVDAQGGYRLALIKGKLRCQNAKGKTLSAVPAKVKKGEEAERLLALRDWLVAHERECIDTVERAMLRSLPFPFDVLKAVFSDPAWRAPLVDTVVVCVDGAGTLLPDEAGFLRAIDPERGVGVVTLDGETQWLQAERVAVPHPILLDEREDYRELATELGITQGIPQLFRETFERPAAAPRRAGDPKAAASRVTEFADGKFLQLNHVLGKCRTLGYRVRVVNTPPGVLHFKSDCGLLDSHTVFSTARLAGSGCFEGYRVIEAVEGEEAATNLIRFNEPVFLRTGFPKTLALLQSEGYKVITLSADQAALVDGGLSCMSLRFSL